jgi:hypothetical protein
MAISAVAVTTTDTLETFRVEFNNLVADVASLEQVGAANIVISDGGNIGTASDADAMSISAGGVVTFSQTASFAAGITVSNLDIDGSTDIGAAIVDADLFIVDDGASGTNRKTAASRIKTYIADVTLTTAAQTAITSVGTLTALQVDNINVNGNTISASSGAVNITPAGGSAIVLDGTINVDAGVVTGVTSLTSNNILIADAGTIGSASSTSAIAIASDGDVTLVDDLKLGSDSARIFFGASNDVLLTHIHDSGLRLTHGGSGNNLPVVFQLKSEEDFITEDDVIASLEFAAGDNSGTDAATVAAGIHAIAEDTFSASANKTRLSFTTGVSETAAASATAKMTLSSAGKLGIGTTAPTHALHVASTGDAVLFLQADTDNDGEDNNAKIILSQDGGLNLARVGFVDNSNILEFYNTLSPGSDSHIRFGTDNAERMTILQTGNVEIHTDLLMDHDGALISFGANDEITLTHVHDSGLALKHTATADDKPIILTLQTGETDIAINDVIGAINFQAPDEGTGTDAILVAAGIEAVSEGDFSSSNNATKLSFKTGASEAAAEKMSLSSVGLLTIADDFMIKDGGTIGVASTNDAMTISSAGIVTFKDDIIIKDGGTIGSASAATAITIASSGLVTTSTNLAVSGQIIGQSHLQLDADYAQIFLGEDQDVIITHYPDSGVTISNTATGDNKPITISLENSEDDISEGETIGQIHFRAAGEDTGTDAVLIAATIAAVSEGDFSASNNATKLSFRTAASEIATEKMSLSSIGILTIADDFMIKDGGTIGVASTNDAITISSAGIVTFKDDILIKDGGTIGVASTNDAITISSAGIVTFKDDIVIKDDGTIGTATTPGLITLLDNNVRLTNTAINDGDAVLQLYSEDAGISSSPDMFFWRNSSSPADNDFIGKILFYGENDASEQTPYASMYAQIKDVTDGTEDGQFVFSTLVAGVTTLYTIGSDATGATFTIPNGSHIGSAGDRDSIAIASDGVVTMNQIPVFSAGINVSGGSIAGTLSTAAQTNITSLGTLTTLTVDDITINGSTISDAGDFALDISGDIILDANGADIIFKDNGTEIGRFTNSSSDFVIESKVQDKDIIFKGDDGGVVISALTLDMSAAGGAHFNGYLKSPNYFWSNTDNGEVLRFGTSAEIRVHHVHDVGLTFSNNKTDTDNRPFVLQLKSEEDAIVADNVIASIEMSAGDSDGTDGATVAAGIHAIAEDTFSASANKTKLVFTTGESETAAASATAKMSLSSAGLLTIADDFMLKDGGTIGVASTNDAMTISSAGIVTFKDDIIIKDGGTIGAASATDAITIASSGALTFVDDVTFTGANYNVKWDKSDDALEFVDNAKAVFGFGHDLRIYHDGNHSVIEDVGTGNLNIKTNGSTIAFTKGDSENLAIFYTDGGAVLYHDAVQRLTTTADGATIVGELLTTGFSSSDFAAAKIVMNRSATDGTDAGDNIIDETDSDNMLMENVTSWVTSGFTIRDSFGNHLQTVNGVS